MRIIKPIVLALMVCAGGASSLTAQAAADDPDASPTPFRISVGYEVARDHLRYTFENPSTIDTDFPVPHSFTQRYVANNQWVVASARYSIRDDGMQTEFAFTPERQAPGSDLDTFNDPHSDVVVSGTAGDVLIRSLRFAQWSEGRLFGMPWRVGYAFRRDRSQFLPTDRIVTHSNPQSEVHSGTLGHETTISQVHEIPIDVSQSWPAFSSWRLVARASVSPLMFARLVTKLPDKYPGHDIIFDAKAVGFGGAIELVRDRRWPMAMSVEVGQSWGYTRAAQFRRDRIAAAARVRF